jgi:hypothetical protein
VTHLYSLHRAGRRCKITPAASTGCVATPGHKSALWTF